MGGGHLRDLYADFLDEVAPPLGDRAGAELDRQPPLAPDLGLLAERLRAVHTAESEAVELLHAIWAADTPVTGTSRAGSLSEPYGSPNVTDENDSRFQ